jgi:hypothetical protein
MAAEVIGESVRDWLSAQRQDLNGRFNRARRRFPRLDPLLVLALCRELLPGVSGNGEAGSAELLSAVYDLILLHAGRGTLAPDGSGSLPGVAVLMRETFSALRRLLLTRPGSLAGALSNAVENLGPCGVAFARRLANVAEFVSSGDDLLNTGVVLAWRLGYARCRSRALALAPRLPPGAVLRALGLAHWPIAAAPLAIAGLAAHGWRRPEALLTKQTLDQLERDPERAAPLIAALALPSSEPLDAWSLANRVGNFRGFDGHFNEPPLLLNSSSEGNRHRFWVRSGAAKYRMDADVFGWVCRPDPSADFPSREVPPPLRKKGREPRPSPLVVVTAQGESVKLPQLAGATSVLLGDGMLAFTLADSFRVRVLAPVGKSL